MRAGHKKKWEGLGGVVSISRSNRHNIMSVYLNCEAMEMIGDHQIIFDQRKMKMSLPTLAMDSTNKISPTRGFTCAAKYGNADELIGEYLLEKSGDEFYLTRIVETETLSK